jgi:hypothetical protein
MPTAGTRRPNGGALKLEEVTDHKKITYANRETPRPGT